MNVWVSPSWDSLLITSEFGLGFWSSQSTPVILRYSWCGKHCSGSYHGSCGIFIDKPFNLEFFPSLSNFPCSVQSLSHVQLFATPWTAARQASLSITNSLRLLKLLSTETVMPSSHLIFCRLLLLLPPNPSQHQSLFQWVNSSHEVAKVLEFQLYHQSFQRTRRTDL